MIKLVLFAWNVALSSIGACSGHSNNAYETEVETLVVAQAQDSEFSINEVIQAVRNIQECKKKIVQIQDKNDLVRQAEICFYNCSVIGCKPASQRCFIFNKLQCFHQVCNCKNLLQIIIINIATRNINRIVNIFITIVHNLIYAQTSFQQPVPTLILHINMASIPAKRLPDLLFL